MGSPGFYPRSPLDLGYSFRMRILLFIGFLLLNFLVLSGCGYKTMLQSSGSSASATSERAPRLAVRALRNDSPEPWLDRILGDSLRREVGSRSTVRLVNDPAQAELILRGRIHPLVTQSQSFSSFVAALEYSITLQADLEIVRASGEVIRLDPAMLTESDVYLASADIEVTRTHRLEALRRLSDVLASRVADTVELMQRPIQAPGGGEEER